MKKEIEMDLSQMTLVNTDTAAIEAGIHGGEVRGWVEMNSSENGVYPVLFLKVTDNVSVVGYITLPLDKGLRLCKNLKDVIQEAEESYNFQLDAARSLVTVGLLARLYPEATLLKANEAQIEFELEGVKFKISYWPRKVTAILYVKIGRAYYAVDDLEALRGAVSTTEELARFDKRVHMCEDIERWLPAFGGLFASLD